MADNIVPSTTSINDLNNDCLKKILMNIEVNERMKLRTVCKTWCNAIDDSWREVRAVKIIEKFDTTSDFKPEMTGTNKRVQIAVSCELGETLSAGVMKRCGDVITAFHQTNTDFGLFLAAKHCSNLEKLVTTVETKEDDENASQVLAINRKLRIFKLYVDFEDVHLCFSNIPTDYLERFTCRLSFPCGPSSVAYIGVREVIRGSSLLKELGIDYLEGLGELIGQKSALQSLTLAHLDSNKYTEKEVMPILKLRNLRKLKITSYRRALPVTDHFLMALSENLPLLEAIIIDGSPLVTDEGFRSLARLEKLRELTVSGCPGVTDTYLELFSGLEALCMTGCDVQDGGVIALLYKTVTLRHLSLRGTLITDATLEAAARVTMNRSNGIVLNFYISDLPTSPLLNIVHTNLYNHGPFFYF